MLPDHAFLFGRCELFDFGDRLGLAVDCPIHTKRGHTGLANAAAHPGLSSGDILACEVLVGKEHLTVAMQLDPDLFNGHEPGLAEMLGRWTLC